MKLPVETTPEADAQIRAIDGWWRQNRPQAPDLFLDELTSAFAVLARAPEIGRRYVQSRVAGVRRVLLKGVRYHVYYVPRGSVVTVLAVWHAQRGGNPPLGVR